MSQQFLERTAIFNRPLFEKIPVDMKVYGSRGLEGNHVTYNRQMYDPIIQRAVDRQLEEASFEGDKSEEILRARERLKAMAKFKQDIKFPSMKSKLEHPENLWEIVEFGIDHDAYATQAVYEMMAQLRVQTTFPCLVAVDDWNECFPVSEYVSIRYDNTRFWGYIPNYHLTMPRVFRSWDGEKFKRGLKICATSWKNQFRRDYRPELLGVRDSEMRTVREFSYAEYANYVAYYEMQNILHEFPKEKLDYFYLLTQGNGRECRRLLATLY